MTRYFGRRDFFRTGFDRRLTIFAFQAILERTGYRLDVTTGQRKYGAPPGCEGPAPGRGCEVYCGNIPNNLYEDELIPLFEKCGKIWDLR